MTTNSGKLELSMLSYKQGYSFAFSEAVFLKSALGAPCTGSTRGSANLDVVAAPYTTVTKALPT